jgi:hypothetical protein
MESNNDHEPMNETEALVMDFKLSMKNRFSNESMPIQQIYQKSRLKL